MTIFNRKKHSCLLHFLGCFRISRTFAGGVLDYLTTPLAKVVGIIYFFLQMFYILVFNTNEIFSTIPVTNALPIRNARLRSDEPKVWLSGNIFKRSNSTGTSRR